MLISRRAFASGALGAAIAAQLPTGAFAQDSRYAAALEAIRAYGEAHRRHFGLPGMTLALTAPDGFGTVMNFGFANAEAKTPIAAGTLFQIGSISKLLVAAVIHQLAAEGRLHLSDRFSDLLPEIPLPQGNAIRVQHLLDHVAGLPADAPLFPDGGLWTAYAPGEHWHYSNTAYDMLGNLVERTTRKPLARALHERIFAPFGMRSTRGSIIADDRFLYAQGYEVADGFPYTLGMPLAPASWVDVTFGAGSVASTGDDMLRLMRSLAGAAQGRGGLGLDAAAARQFASHSVPSDTPGMTYGNGLMHVAGAGRNYLHHTGGMVSFSSAFHLDTASGAGAFASTTLTGLAGMRPRLLTRFAVDALTNAAAGKPLPIPPTLYVASTHSRAYIGRFAGPAGSFEIVRGSPLTIVSAGKSAPLQPIGGELFRTTHPAFRAFTFMFERKNNAVVTAAWGADTYVRAGSGATAPRSDPALAQLAGRYVNDSPWLGLAPVVERGGRLWLGTEVPLVETGAGYWRVGEERWSPERAHFGNFIDGRPNAFVLSGEKFIRHDI